MSNLNNFQFDERAVRYIFIVFLLSVTFILRSQNREFPYSLNKNDLFIIPVGLGSMLTYHAVKNDVTFLTENEGLNLNRNSINWLDRTATYNWDANLDMTSDYTLLALTYTPLLLAAPQIKNLKWKNALTIGIMYAEVYMLTRGLTKLTKHYCRRIRPFLYNSGVDENFRIDYFQETSTYQSFLSGHTSGAFASAVFFSKMFTDIYGKSKWSTAIWIGSLSVAATTAYLRVVSGKHYPTDVLAGAALGSVIGYLVPVLHKNKSPKLSLFASGNTINLNYTF